MNTTAIVTAAVDQMYTLRDYIGMPQRRALYDALKSEEGDYFAGMINGIAKIIDATPSTYGTDGVKNKTIHLHYFIGRCDWWIVEKDIDLDGEGQIQAFGYADLGYGPELGYISLKEIINAGAELDCYFAPRPWSEQLSNIERRNAQRAA